MKTTYQNPATKQSIFEHGESVWKHTQQLILGNFENYKLPQWFLDNHHFIVNNLHNWDTVRLYSTFHDCGKPFCLVVDDEGKQHFPNHTAVSKETFLKFYPYRTVEARLIGNDMVLHSGSAIEIDDLGTTHPIEDLITHLVVAFAEIHANAELFGGITSTSFRIKYKKLDRIGKKIVAGLSKHQDSYAYVFVAKDLPAKSHIVVQACHAIYERVNQDGAKHPSIILLAAEDETHLKEIMQYLISANIKFYIFREPMPPYENSITAIATENLDLEKKQLLKQYKLLSL